MDINKFPVKINGEDKMAIVLTTFDFCGDNYCLYLVPKGEEDYDVYCDKLVEGILETIPEGKDKELINKIVSKIIEILNTKQND